MSFENEHGIGYPKKKPANKKPMKKYEPSKKEIAKGNAKIESSNHPKETVKKLNNELKKKRMGMK